MKKKYLKSNNLPPRVSILWPIVWWLVLERFNAPMWLFGAMGVLILISYVGEVYRLWTGTAVDILGNDKGE